MTEFIHVCAVMTVMGFAECDKYINADTVTEIELDEAGHVVAKTADDITYITDRRKSCTANEVFSELQPPFTRV